MSSARARLATLLLLVLASACAAQSGNASLRGTVADPTGTAIPNARVSITDATTGQTFKAQTDPNGKFELPNVTPGDYDITVAASGFALNKSRVTAAPGSPTQADVKLAIAPISGPVEVQAPPGIASGLSGPVKFQAPAPQQSSSQQTSQQQPSPQKPSLSDLGFPTTETKGSAEEQARLDKRSHMLKIHQRMGLITIAPLAATLITGGMAKGERERSATGTTLVANTNTTGRNVHMALGTTTAAMYFTTAYFAIRAPKIAGTPTRGPIKLHKTLAWIHGTGMILTPILGAMAYNQLNNGQRVHGLASAHAPVAYTTAIAYGAAILSVSLKW